MAVVTLEGRISGGNLCLPEGTSLPENARFQLVISSLDETPVDETIIIKTFETKKVSAEEWATRGAEIDAAFTDYPNEEAATMRIMRSKAAKREVR